MQNSMSGNLPDTSTKHVYIICIVISMLRSIHRNNLLCNVIILACSSIFYHHSFVFWIKSLDSITCSAVTVSCPHKYTLHLHCLLVFFHPKVSDRSMCWVVTVSGHVMCEFLYNNNNNNNQPSCASEDIYITASALVHASSPYTSTDCCPMTRILHEIVRSVMIAMILINK